MTLAKTGSWARSLADVLGFQKSKTLYAHKVSGMTDEPVFHAVLRHITTYKSNLW